MKKSLQAAVLTAEMITCAILLMVALNARAAQPASHPVAVSVWSNAVLDASAEALSEVLVDC